MDVLDFQVTYLLTALKNDFLSVSIGVGGGGSELVGCQVSKRDVAYSKVVNINEN